MNCVARFFFRRPWGFFGILAVCQPSEMAPLYAQPLGSAPPPQSAGTVAQDRSSAMTMAMTLDQANAVAGFAGSVRKDESLTRFEWRNSLGVLLADLTLDPEGKMVASTALAPQARNITPQTLARFQEVMKSPGVEKPKIRHQMIRWNFPDGSWIIGDFDDGKFRAKSTFDGYPLKRGSGEARTCAEHARVPRPGCEHAFGDGKTGPIFKRECTTVRTDGFVEYCGERSCQRRVTVYVTCPDIPRECSLETTEPADPEDCAVAEQAKRFAGGE